jgi:hypothetical protein
MVHRRAPAIWNVQRRSSILCVRPAQARYLIRRAWGRSGGVGEANRQQIVVEDERIEVFVVSNGGGGSVTVVVPVGELWRMMDGSGRRCGMESPVL